MLDFRLNFSISFEVSGKKKSFISNYTLEICLICKSYILQIGYKQKDLSPLP